jgi:hypothetical protein
MKNFIIAVLMVFAIGTANAQNYNVLSYDFRNGNMTLRRNGAVFLNVPIMSTYFGICYSTAICVYGDRALNINTGYRLLYFPMIGRDTIIGYTRQQATDLLNQAVSVKRGNYIGAYKQSNLYVSDTARVGVYYYDTDSLLYRVRTASGWKSLQPKE